MDQWVSASHQVAKYWSLNYRISASNEYSGLIFFSIYWFDLFAIQRTIKSLFWHHNLKALTLQPSVVFIVQLSHLYVNTGQAISLTIWTFVGKVMSLLFNMLSSFVIALWTFKAVKILFSLQPSHQDQQMFPGQTSH